MNGSTLVQNSSLKWGYLLFVRNGSLYAEPFDTDCLETSGDAVLMTPVGVNAAIQLANFSASANGVLVASRQGFTKVQLTWFDRQGKALGTAGRPDAYLGSRLSPDGTRAVLRRDEGGGDPSVRLLDLARGLQLRSFRWVLGDWKKRKS